jgi:predicted N-acetyltransferase YhbS
MSVIIRPAVPEDAEACGRIMYDAFKGIADAHNFPPDFPSVEAAMQLATLFIARPSVFGVVAERGGQVVGSNFMAEGDPIRAIGPITVDPAFQGSRVGRRLMEAALDRAQGAAGVRLVQDAFNIRSFALYASLGFDAMEPLLLMRGTPRSGPAPGFAVRPLVADDIGTCARLCTAVHGVERTAELRDALQVFKAFVVKRDGRVTGYLTAPTLWVVNHGVAETEVDMQALILGAAAASAEPVSFLLPVRQADLFRWCLEEGLRVVKPMTLIALGTYQKPKGGWFPSVFY